MAAVCRGVQSQSIAGRPIAYRARRVHRKGWPSGFASSRTHPRTARRACQRFGKRSRHPAQLDFGDCFAYAPAFESGEPLRYKGNDFARTAIESTMP